ncbi:putative phospholipid-transporting ATPase C24B11.12c [Hypsizygus marmoreus]|uniref:Phospholipid-transporting ATPase n=1 Tax=Hypsizygus marmoreus TaxID=39966 RepID=A0A369JJ38_HYPMA|nr:putative phospholipid-transporting ATPase C24B11.12c [Hypsizygus marmoreus]
MASTKAGAFATWYSRIAAFKVEDIFSQKRLPGPPRTVFVNEDIPEHYFDHKGRHKADYVYTSNQVITSKYTVITFLPRNLLEQFRRIANMFFLAIATLQFFPKFSTIAPGVVILPLIIILAVTAFKDGYEDIKRHQSDKRVNQSSVRVLAGGDWNNANGMQAKTKTFVRGLVRPLRRTRKPDSSQAAQAYSDEDIEFDGDGPDVADEKRGRLSPHWEKTLWEDLHVGDIVKIIDNEPFPADILICATSEETKTSLPALSHLRDAAKCADRKNSFRLNCDRPDTDMYRMKANVTVDGDVSPIDMSMMLLRGTVLRNTRWVIGIVLYTGLDTKIVMNSGGTPSKRSKVEAQMNPQVFFNLTIMALMAVVCAIADSLLEVKYFPLQAPWLFGDDLSDDNPRINGLITWAYSLLTFQTIVPISLYISIEFVRTCQAAFIYFDADISYEKTGQATISRSWNLSDDLGQIEYIFSDKTDTLTQNSMVFRQCSIGGVAYRGDVESLDAPEELAPEIDSVKPFSITANAEKDDRSVEVNVWAAAAASSKSAIIMESSPKLPYKMPTKPNDAIVRFRDSSLYHDIEAAVDVDPDSEGATHARLLNGFFTVLALCHTVLTSVDPLTGQIEYKAQSPDEAALVQAAADVSFVFSGRDRETLTLRTPSSAPDVEKYELLNILEFTSARKRMSVVLRKLGGEDGQLFLLTKGADNVIFQRLRASERELMDETEEHLSEFANGVSMDDREARIEAVSNELEQDLRLLGATAIEDRLQDGVPETIADLKRTGIRIWVATGDKLETAIAIGRSTNLIASDSNIIIIRGGIETGRPVHQQMTHAMSKYFLDSGIIGEDLPRPSTSSRDADRHHIPLQRITTGTSSVVGAGNGDRPGGFVLVIDGAALLHAFEDEQNKALLLRLATLCEGVICCRVSPLQKALVVRLVKDGLGAMTLAIGDGANDVSMIQAADVGVGISGEEGLQAVNSSDYAIAQFRFLKKLLLVHGHWSYARNGTMILNFFYKNVVPVGILWWFQIYEGWSGYFVFDYIYILFWNSIWTIAPVIGIGLFDRFLDSHVLMDVPELYHYGRRGTWFGLKSFFIYMFDGLFQSVIIFFLIVYAYKSPTARKDGYDVHLTEFSTTMAIAGVMVADIFTGLSATAWTAWLFFAVFIGIFIVWMFTIIYSLISPGYAVTSLYGNYYLLFTSAKFWLSIPLTFCLALTPRLITKCYQVGFAPDDLNTIRWVNKFEPDLDLKHDAHVTHLSALKRPPSAASRRTSRSYVNDSTATVNLRRQSVDVRAASRTDMATGLVSIDRGFDFAMEEHGVAMRRMQSNLSERRSGRNLAPMSPLHEKGKSTLSQMFSLRRKRKGPRKSE